MEETRQTKPALTLWLQEWPSQFHSFGKPGWNSQGRDEHSSLVPGLKLSQTMQILFAQVPSSSWRSRSVVLSCQQGSGLVWAPREGKTAAELAGQGDIPTTMHTQ